MVKAKKPSKKNKLRHWETFDTVVTMIAILVCFITIYPMWYVICMSISDPMAAVRGEVSFWPVGFSLKSYEIVIQNTEFWTAFRNSILYVIVGCVLVLFNTVAVAYPLTRPNLKGRRFLNTYLLIPMYFGGGLIPFFLVVTQLGLYNNPLALILPGSYSIWNIIMCRTYFKSSIPQELSEAAMLDGASNMQVLRKVILPLAKPIIAVIMIYTIVGIWNAWFDASIFTTHKEIQPVQLFLRRVLVSQQSGVQSMAGMTAELQHAMAELSMSNRQLRYSMIVIVTLPILLVYPMFQKYFTKGVVMGSLKG